MVSRLRALWRLFVYLGVMTPLCMVFQGTALRLNLPVSRTFPLWFHRQVCRVVGVQIERRVTLMSSGETLVGQDKLISPGGRRSFKGELTIRFHLAPGARASRADGGEMILIQLGSGARWSFLWEAATAHIEDSVRQSSHIGFYRTQQIVLSAAVAADAEVAWIFTKQVG